MTRARIATHLSLDRFAEIMGINPMHFAGAAGSAVFPAGGGCQDVWPQHSWQHVDVVSREDIAEAIHDAEEDIRRVLRRPVAPEFVVDTQSYPVRHRQNGRGYYQTKIATLWRDIQAVGRRGVTLLEDDAPVVRTDADGDGYAETMTVTVLAADLPTGFNLRSVRVYFPGEGAFPEWEVRPVKRALNGSGDLVITFKSWLLFDPALWEKYPTTTPFGPIDADDNANYLDVVDLYIEGIEPLSAAASFGWHGVPTCGTCGGAGCGNCAGTSQDACLTIADQRLGLVIPSPVVWNEDTEVFDSASWAIASANPSQLTMYYQCGLVDDRYTLGLTDDPLSQYMAQTITWLAAARLEGPPCSCGVTLEEFNNLRHDMALVDRSRGVFFSVLAPDMITNPFGTRRGEVRAWDRISRVMAELASLSGGAL